MGDTSRTALSPRAGIAMLTLQLRAVLREAEEAERAELVWDGEAAAAELRGRLDPMVRDQRRTFEVELWQARAAASERVDAVREELAARRAVEIAARRAAADDAPESETSHEIAETEPAEPELPAPEPVEEPSVDDVEPEFSASEPVETAHVEVPLVGIIEPVEPVEPVEPEVVEAHVVEADVVEAGVVEPDAAVEPDEPHPSPHVVGGSHDETTGTRGTSGAAWSRPATEPAAPLTADDVRSIVDEAIERFAARHVTSQPSGMDPEAFSRAFASAFGAAFSAMLDERVAALNAGPAVAPPWVRYAPQAPVEVKKSFWTNMWHADVMLSVLAAVIVLVILIAWST